MKNTHRVIILKPDGTEEIRECNSKTQYETLRDSVGGYIETLPYFNSYKGKRCVAYCNEEGKLKGLPRNRPAQIAWHECDKNGSFDSLRTVIAGSIAIIQKI